MNALHWFPLYVLLNTGLVTLLAFNVSRLRMRERVANGDGDLKVMKQAIRAHGNGVEHVTIFGLCVLALELGGAASGLLSVLVIGFTLSRVGHAYSMLSSAFNIRRAAAGGTYLFELVALIALGTQLLSQ